MVSYLKQQNIKFPAYLLQINLHSIITYFIKLSYKLWGKVVESFMQMELPRMHLLSKKGWSVDKSLLPFSHSWTLSLIPSFSAIDFVISCYLAMRVFIIANKNHNSNQIDAWNTHDRCYSLCQFTDLSNSVSFSS